MPRSRRLGLYPKFMLLMVALAVVPVGVAGFQILALNQRGVQAALLELLAFALAAGLVSFWAARRLVEPIVELTRGAQAIASGDFDVGLRLRSSRELEELAEAFNYMAKRLKAYNELHVERLVAEKLKTEAILFSIADGILMADYEGRIQLVNREAREALGLAPSEALEGRCLRDLIPDPAAGRLLAESLADPQDGRARELTLKTRSGRRVYQLTARPVVSPGRTAPMGVLAALHDVTLERELERLKETFLHGMTHDLRSPMASIRGFLELLLKDEPGTLDPAQRRMLESMDKSSLRLLGMINNMLDMAKMKAGKMSVELSKDVCLRESCEKALEVVEPLARLKGIELAVSGQAPALSADPDLIDRVLGNLLSNAVKFTPAGGRVWIELSARGGEAEAAVCDTGEGVPEDLRGRLFGLFEQARDRRTAGTGLGLAICKFIVEAHHGRIWAEPGAAGGSRFLLRIPLGLAQGADGAVARGGLSASRP